MKKRYCLALDLVNDPEKISKYRWYHTDEGIWEEIKEGTRAAGVEMEIYNVDNRLFMICEVNNETDFFEARAKMNSGESNPHWEQLMQHFQQALPGRPLEWILMEKVYEVK
ncbi:MAG TPA: L-rhamnose mutarotase [Niabella sp.]